MPDAVVQVKPLLEVENLSKVFDVSKPWLNRVRLGNFSNILVSLG